MERADEASAGYKMERGAQDQGGGSILESLRRKKFSARASKIRGNCNRRRGIRVLVVELVN